MKFNNGKDKIMHLDIYKKHFYYGLQMTDKEKELPVLVTHSMAPNHQ